MNYFWLDTTYSELIGLVDDGIEFPEALARVSEKHGLGAMRIKRLVAEYDRDGE